MTVSRRFHISILVGAILALFIPAVAEADGGVLLSGYAPPAAGDQAILGVPEPASAPTRANASAPSAASNAQLPLAQPAATDSVAATGTAARSGTSAARHGSAHHARAGRTATAQLPTAPAAVAAAAADRSYSSIFAWWQLALAAGLAILTTVLVRGWRRDDG